MGWIAFVGVVSAGIAAAAGYRAYRRLLAEVKRTKILFEVSIQLNSTIKKKDLVAMIMETAATVTDSEGSSVILVDPERGDLYFEVATGEKGNEVKQIRLEFGEGIAGWVAQTGESVIVADAAEDTRWSNRVANRTGMGTRNLLCVPIVNRNETIGVLQVLNKKGGQAYTHADQELLLAITAPVAIALENAQLYEALEYSMQVLKETTAAKERMESELRIAGEIQHSFLPKTMVSDNRVDVYAHLQPAREVGGDFFNYFYIDDEHLFFTLGDVSDKGIPSALFMAVTMTHLKGKLRADMSPGQLLAMVNDELCKDDPTMFATIFCAMLNVRTGELAYSDGGHCPAYRLQSDGGLLALEAKKGLPLGAFAETPYFSQTLQLATGDRIVLYSDGITEAENSSLQQFSADRLRHCLSETAAQNNQELVQRVLGEVERFAAGAAQSDDIAILAVQFFGEDSELPVVASQGKDGSGKGEKQSAIIT